MRDNLIIRISDTLFTDTFEVSDIKVHKLSVLLLLLVMFSLWTTASSEALGIIRGYVYDAKTGLPLKNAYVLILDYINFKTYIVRTNEKGYYERALPYGKYCIFVVHDAPETPGIDYVPSYDPNASFDNPLTLGYERPEYVSNLSLVPGASLSLKGMMEYVGGTYTGYYAVYLLDGSMRRLRLRDYYPNLKGRPLVTYGNSIIDFMYLRDALPEVFREDSMVIVPADIGVYPLFSAIVFDSRKNGLERFNFTIDLNGSPFLLGKGDHLTVNYAKKALYQLITLERSDFAFAESRLEEAESLGFYVASERDDLRVSLNKLSQAEALIEQGEYIKALLMLGEVYITCRHVLMKRLNYMYVVAKVSAYILPSFLAFFAMALAFFLYETPRKKALSFIVLYVVSMAGFCLTYPGFHLVMSLGETRNFILVSLASGLCILFLVFLLPKVFKEPELPSEFNRLSILVITFSLAKRYAKLRRLRLILTLFSIALLIWAFTTLTSISTVYGLSIDSYRHEGVANVRALIFRRIIDDMPYQLPYPDYLWAQRLESTTLVSPIAWSDVDASAQFKLRSRYGEITLRGVMGIIPSSEDKLVNFRRAIVEGSMPSDEERGYIMISRGIAERIKVNVKDKVLLVVQTGTIRVVVGEFTVKAILDDNYLSALKDLDGYSYLPCIKQGGSLSPLEPGDVIFMSFNDAIHLPPKDEKGFSKYVHIYRVLIQVDESRISYEELARSIVYLRGYQAWTINEGLINHYYFGAKLEIRGYQDLLAPLLIVIMNVGIVMYSAVRERERDVLIFTAVGFNPTHLALLFIAESIVMGFIGGGLGYLSGLATFKFFSFLGTQYQINIREKLEWYWSVIGLLLALAVSVASSLRAAFRAMYLVIPSLKRKIRLESEAERKEIMTKIMRAHSEKRYDIPLRIHEHEIIFFENFFIDSLSELTSGLMERVERISSPPMKEEEGRRVKSITFNFKASREGRLEEVAVELRLIKERNKDYFVPQLYTKPLIPETSVETLDRIAEIAKDICMRWSREKSRIISSI